MTHTHEPWTTEEWSDGTLSIEGKRLTIANLFGNFEEDAEVYPNARRIVAAVNACTGVTLGEGADVKRLVDELIEADESICRLCKVVNPQHANCTSCPETDSRRAALAPFVESE